MMNADELDIRVLIDGIEDVSIAGTHNSKNMLHPLADNEGGDKIANFNFHGKNLGNLGGTVPVDGLLNGVRERNGQLNFKLTSRLFDTRHQAGGPVIKLAHLR